MDSRDLEGSSPDSGPSETSWDSRSYQHPARTRNSALEMIDIQRPLPKTGFSSAPLSLAAAKAHRLRNNLNRDVRKYVLFDPVDDSSPSWVSKREIPSSIEIKGEDENAEGEDAIEIPVNRVHAAWKSKENYLECHYQLLREDAISPLRNSVAEVKESPYMREKDSTEDTGIYDKVFIVGFTFANSGIAARISFSMERIGKKVNWEQSKRLMSGTIIALTTKEDKFQNTCIVGVVAARALAGLEQNPPEINIFFGAPEEIEIDPQQEWIMVESRNGFFEAYRHTLKSLQKTSKESFPLVDQIVSLSKDIEPPEYLQQQPCKDLSHLFKSPIGKDFSNVDLLEDWPENAESHLDASQVDALRRILTKRLAIVQGPPGTGKTHVSVVALETLHKNMKPGDPPILVASHTNHALDQLLRHVKKFDENFIRLGGFTHDLDNIKPRTMYEVKMLLKNPEVQGGARGPANTEMRRLVKEMTEILRPLIADLRSEEPEPIKSEFFVQYGIITEAQRESLIQGAKDWVRADRPGAVLNDLLMWADKDLIPFTRPAILPLYDAEPEEVDLEFEQLKELEAEAKVDEEEEVDTLRGHSVRLGEPLTGRPRRGFTEQQIKFELEQQDLWQIKYAYRGPIYRWMQQQLKAKILEAFRQKARYHSKLVQQLKIGRWEIESNFLEQAKVVGMTTTGLSKNRGLLNSVKPKIVLIEEAAETLEAFVTAACMDSVEHLILVGDHQQLRGHCAVPELQGYPWFLDVSMFERLVRHQVGHTQLMSQRRMIPEIRRGLTPIYKDLKDHPSVLERQPVPGMGGVNSYFFAHDWSEGNDAFMSKVNYEEASMVIHFFERLLANGLETQQVTILTYYNGQRKAILKSLRRNPKFQGRYFKVVTVDSYQGEENDVVILSLVRSNFYNAIGFLGSVNRLCVALSRAQRGFYIFGNAMMLCNASYKWFQIVQTMASNPRRVGFYLPLTCDVHGNTEYVQHPDEFRHLNGGCSMPCSEELECGHRCELYCHSFSHKEINCMEECVRPRECGHRCLAKCFQPCRCICTIDPPRPVERTLDQPISADTRSQSTSSIRHGHTGSQVASGRGSPFSQLSDQEIAEQIDAFQAFSKGGHVQADKKLVEQAHKETVVTMGEEAQKRLKEADDAAAAALFGDVDLLVLDDTPKKKSDGVELVRTTAEGRGVWKGTYNPKSSAAGTEDGKGKGPMNLLD